MEYTTVIGLEIHAELGSKTKAFCSCKNSFGKEENSNTCPKCTALPGTLPTISKGVITLAARACAALNCTINERMSFDRKNYFYPDLPKAYQITQQENPISSGGVITISDKDFRINNIHLEEDAGKLIHDDEQHISRIDFNRAGIGLIEIVTEPDFSSAEEVCSFITFISRRLKYSDVCDAKMEEGSLRVDVNISVMPKDSDTLGTRTELKNLSSLRAISRAIEYETARQINIIENGGKVICQTRRFDESDGKTYPMREKEDISDYRYFPEPDIPPISITKNEITKIIASLTELPDKRYSIYTKDYNLSSATADLIVSEKVFSDFFDDTVALCPQYREVANLMTGEVLHSLSGDATAILNTKLTPEALAQIAEMSASSAINKNSAKKLASLAIESGIEPKKYAKEHCMIMSDDKDEISDLVDKVLNEKPGLLKDYRNGNTKLFGFLMGEVMRAAKGSANPSLIKEILTEKLSQGEN